MIFQDHAIWVPLWKWTHYHVGAKVKDTPISISRKTYPYQHMVREDIYRSKDAPDTKKMEW